MKKTMIAILILSLLLGLAACNTQPPTNDHNTQPTTNGTNNDQRTHDHNLWIFGGTLSIPFTDTGLYHWYQGYLCYADINEGTSVFLCSKPDCLHYHSDDRDARETCEAHIESAIYLTPLYFWNDHIYYICTDSYGTQLYRRNAIGGDEIQVGSLGSKYTQQQQTVRIFRHVRVDQFIYYNAIVSASVLTEDFVYTSKDVANYIGRVNLETGTEEILLEKTDLTLTLLAAQSGAVLYGTEGIGELDILDPNAATERLSQPTTLEILDVETGNTRTLLTKTYEQFSQVTMVSEGKVYFMPANKVGQRRPATFVYDLNTSEETLLTTDSLKHINGKFALRLNPDTEIWDVMNLQTGATMPIDVEGSIFVEDVGPEGVLFDVFVRLDDGTNINYYQYATFDSLEDGIQPSDLTTLYTTKSYSGGNHGAKN